MVSDPQNPPLGGANLGFITLFWGLGWTYLVWQQASGIKHTQHGQKAQLRGGPLDLANILLDGTNGCEEQPHKV